MPIFKGEYEESFTLDIPVEKAIGHFSSFETIIANYGGLERSDIVDEKTIHFVLKPKNAVGSAFRGEYSCEYNFAADNIFEWRSVGKGNMVARGRIEFKALGKTRTRLTYFQDMGCDIPVNRFLARAVKPVVSRSISGGVREYLERMKKTALQ